MAGGIARRVSTSAIAGITVALAVSSGGVVGGQPKTPARTIDASAGPQGCVALQSDFDGNGYADLAIGAPLDDVGGQPGAGVVNVIYGSPIGLTATGPPADQIWHQNRIRFEGVPMDPAEAGDHFGWSLDTGNFNHDCYADLAIGIPHDDNGGSVDAGAYQTLLGSPNGLTDVGGMFQALVSDEGAPGAFDGWEMGYSLEAVDTLDLTAKQLCNGETDGLDDLLVGMPGTNADEGAVRLYAGLYLFQAAGSGFVCDPILDVSPGDRAGTAVAAGEFMYGAPIELVIGVPGRDVPATGGGTAQDAGMVLIATYYSEDGMVTHEYVRGPSTGDRMAGSPRTGDRVGEVLGVRDLTGDMQQDLVVGVPLDDVGGAVDAGSVNLLPAHFSLLDMDEPGILITQEDVGIGASAAQDRFGASVLIADVGDPLSTDAAGAVPHSLTVPEYDLIIGIPGQDVGGDDRAGAVAIVWWRNVNGKDPYVHEPADTGNRVLHQDKPGVADQADPVDRFGEALWAGHYRNSPLDDLFVGIPFEDVGGIANAGAVHAFAARGTGPSGAADLLWTQDSPSVNEAAQAGDRFGRALR